MQSRYYNPEIGRFLNADGLTSTGQGVLGNNMFAYCCNNPVLRRDPTGHSWLAALLIIACALVLTGCSQKDSGAAPNYQQIEKAPIGSEETIRQDYPNCYSYAIGIYDHSYDPGDFSGAPLGSSVESVGGAVVQDFQKLGRSIRVIDGANSPINDNEYRIALRVSDVDYTRDIVWDYHFMVQTSSGQWAEKHGPGGATVLHEMGTPDNISWNCGSYTGFYNSRIIYFAISPPN